MILAYKLYSTNIVEPYPLYTSQREVYIIFVLHTDTVLYLLF